MRTRYVQQGQVWVPEKRIHSGLGDWVSSLTKKLGIKECGGCSKRRATLNRWVPFGDGARRRGHMPAIAGGAGLTHSYLNSLEAGCDGSDPNIIWCEDFSASDFVGLAPAGPGPGVGVWASENGDVANFNGAIQGQISGGQSGIDVRTKGWSQSIFPDQGNFPHSFCGPGVSPFGPCVARSTLVAGTDGGDSMNGSHNFGPVPWSPSSVYRDVWLRFYYKRLSGYVFNNNQKFISWQHYKRDNGGIFLGGIGDCANGGTSNCACPVQDCSVLDFRNPQNPFNSASLGQNTGNTINVRTLVGHWLFMEQHVRVNDNGVQNGLLEIWINDCGVNGDQCTGTPTKRLDYTNLRYIPGGNGITTTTVGQIAFDIWGNPSDGGTLYFTNIKASQAGPVGFSAAATATLFAIVG